MEGKFCHGRTNALCHSARGLESTASLCREFGVSRKTGFKILGRYEECGVEGLSDPGRRPASLHKPIARASGVFHRAGPLGQSATADSSQRISAGVARLCLCS